MTAQTTKPRQKRLDSCVLALPKWTKTQDKPRQHARQAFKVIDYVADTAIRVENAHRRVVVGITRQLRSLELFSR